MRSPSKDALKFSQAKAKNPIDTKEEKERSVKGILDRLRESGMPPSPAPQPLEGEPEVAPLEEAPAAPEALGLTPEEEAQLQELLRKKNQKRGPGTPGSMMSP